MSQNVVELIPGKAGAKGQRSPNHPTPAGRFSPGNVDFSTVEPLSAAPAVAPPASLESETLYTITCRACLAAWTEPAPSLPGGTRPGSVHLIRCPVPYLGEGDPYPFRIVAKRIRAIATTKPHKCGVRCAFSVAADCRCECLGANHGTERQITPALAVVPGTMPVDRDDLNRLYDRLEAPAWVPPSRRP